MAKYLTAVGMAAIRKKIARLEGKREEVLKSAGEAAQNDPNAYHDNFEYEEGMRQQELFSQQIRNLWEVLQGATAAAEPASDDRVAIGHYVVVERDGHESPEGYVLCGEGEGALYENGCSAASPVGRALLGMAKGEAKTVTMGNRSFSIKVREIRRAVAADFQDGESADPVAETPAGAGDRFADIGVQLPRVLACSLGKPYLVSIEGPNGTGKTPLCAMLTERLGLPYVRGVPAEWEHPAMKLRMIGHSDWLASAMYFLSGVIESSREVLHGKGDVKIMDRSLWSTLAAHYAHDGRRLARLMPLVELAADRLKVPDLTIALEASPATRRARIARKDKGEQVFDGAAPLSDEFMQREAAFYRWLARQWPRVVFITTENCDIESVYEKAVASIRESIPC